MSQGTYSFNPLTAVATAVISLVKWLSSNQYQRDAAAADYFEHLGLTLAAMGAKLSVGEVPRTEGNTFQTLISGYEEKTSRISTSEDLKKLLNSLLQAALTARYLDWHYLNGKYNEVLAGKREDWLAEMQRLSGHLLGLATLVRPGTRPG
jgi:hypothetical protein